MIPDTLLKANFESHPPARLPEGNISKNMNRLKDTQTFHFLLVFNKESI